MRTHHLTRRGLVKLAGAAAASSTSAGLLAGLASQARAESVALNFLGGDFTEQSGFAELADELGRPMGLEVRKNLVSFDDVPTKVLLDASSGVRSWDYVFVYSNWV